MPEIIREPAVSNVFYSGNPIELREMLIEFLNNAPLYNIKPEAVVSPHAGYIYSGKVAAVSYKQFQNLNPKRNYNVLLIGPSHYVAFEGVSFGYYDYWETPLGQVKVNKLAIKDFVKNFPNLPITLNNIPHIREHSLEVQIPFLQMVLLHFSIIPVVYGQVDFRIVEQIIDFFKDNREDTIVVISTDLSHYYPDNVAKSIDYYCNLAVEKLDTNLLNRCEACGKIGLKAIIDYSRRKGWKGKVLDYKTSGDTSGERSTVVGYGSYIFYK